MDFERGNSEQATEAEGGVKRKRRR